MKFLFSALVLLGLACPAPVSAQTIGGPGWTYDGSGRVNAAFESKQRRWANAGVRGGIRNPASRSRNVAAGANTATIQSQMNGLSNAGGGVLRFPAATFRITRTLRVPQNVVLEGRGIGRTVLRDALATNNRGTEGTVLLFENLSGSAHQVGGVRNMTLRGPLDGTPNAISWTTARPNVRNTMVAFRRSEDLFLDRVSVINAGMTPFTAFGGAGHHTLRNCTFDGAWNKGIGGQGYVNIAAPDCLVFRCTIRNIRHFALQKQNAKYNVVFRNNIQQDVNFHDDDSGDNLIEKNTITISSQLANAGGARRFSVMGPWSRVHHASRRDNFVYANIIRGSNRRCTDPARVYKGARGFEPNLNAGNNPFSASERVGTGHRFYSVRNGSRRS